MKNNARTFRYSDEVASILAQHDNDFDALVMKCFHALPEIENKIKEETERLEYIKKDAQKLHSELYDIKNTKWQCEQLIIQMERLTDKLKSL